MNAGEPGTGSQSRTRVETAVQTRSESVSYVISQSGLVATYIHEDLAGLVNVWHLDLATRLGVPQELAHSNEELVELLCEDLAHMLRASLVSRVHLLLYDPEPRPAPTGGTECFPLLYKATYEISVQRGLRQEGGRRRNGLLDPPRLPDVGSMEFAILIDWHPKATPEQRARARYPTYTFDWAPAGDTYDATTLVEYRKGSLTADGATIVERLESAVPHTLNFLETR